MSSGGTGSFNAANATEEAFIGTVKASLVISTALHTTSVSEVAYL